MTVGCHKGGAQSGREGHGKTVSQRNPSSLCFKYSRSLPKRRVQIGLNTDSRGENGADGGFGSCGSARPVEIIIDFTNIHGMREAIVTFIQDDLPDDLSASFASQQRDDSAGIENVCQRRSPRLSPL